jgi:hypothetical protein
MRSKQEIRGIEKRKVALISVAEALDKKGGW